MTDLRNGVTPAQHDILDKVGAIADARGSLSGLYEFQHSLQVARREIDEAGNIRRPVADRRDSIVHAAAVLVSLADLLDAVIATEGATA